MNPIRAEKYMVVLREFTGSRIDAERFAGEFTELWTSDRDAILAAKSKWPAPFDEDLIARLNRQQLTREQFEEEWARLWGLSADDIKRMNVLDRVFSACDCLEDPDPRLRLSSYDLRSLAADALRELEGLGAGE